MQKLRIVLILLLIFNLLGCSHKKGNKNARVWIDYQNNKYSLYRNGKPYKINGAAGSTNLEALKEAGGNTIRIWDTTNLSSILAFANKNNISVIVGLPIVESEQTKFYNNPLKVATQFQSIKKVINKYKNDSAILMWCLGNEVYFPKAFFNTKFYTAFNQMVDMIHKDDIDHPITTTMINFQPGQIFQIRMNTHIDLISFNIFGRLGNFRENLKQFSLLWDGPYMILEWGINGPWGDDKQTAWGAFLEPSSTTKAQLYLDRYQEKMPVNDPRFLGSFIFYWGHKQETTHTWFSLFDENGYKTETVSAAQYLWLGNWPINSPPKITNIVINDKNADDNIILETGVEFAGEVFLTNKDTSISKVQWEIYPEDWFKENNVNNLKKPKVLNRVSNQDADLKIKLITPAKEGPYRLFVSIYDKNGYMANANIPFYVLEKK